MEYFDKEYGIEIWGDYACFTRPEFKVERVSYDVITPSAARNIFQAIFWKPAIQWRVTRIEVLNPIKWFSIRRNEVGAVANENMQPIISTEKRQQKNTLMLRDVRYRIYAIMQYIPVSNRTGALRHEPGTDEGPKKYHEQFERRAKDGRCFNQPYLGTRECVANFELLPENSKDGQDLLQESKDFGYMLYDMDFTDPGNIKAMFYRAEMNNGVIIVPSIDSEEVKK